MNGLHGERQGKEMDQIRMTLKRSNAVDGLDPHLDEQFIEKFELYFESNYEKMLQKWVRNVYVEEERFTPNEPFYDNAIENARNVLYLVYDFMRNPNDHHLLQQLAIKVAEEKLAAEVNIGDVVNGINLGRSIMNEFISESTLSKNEQNKAIFQINDFYNVFSYYVVTNFTELKDSIIEEKNRFIQEMHGDRLSILGQIAASFAHEFRNPLTAIKGFISLLEDNYGKEKQTQHYFNVINREMKSLQNVVSQFLLLSKVKGFEDHVVPFCLGQSIKEVLQFLEPRFLEENIDVNTDMEDDIPYVGVKDQLKQVILNIVNNAVEELSRHQGTREILVQAKKDKSSIQISVSNNGPCIPNHLIENIFQPFVSTKELGTGLGLSVCKQIVEKHNGHIHVTSNNNQTVFYIVLSVL
jgi:signal transduction histidine kinase